MPYERPLPDCLHEILIDEATLQARVAELGAQIDKDYADVKNLLLVCVLKGGVMFLTDLMRKITIPHQIDFMSVSSYGVGARSTSGSPMGGPHQASIPAWPCARWPAASRTRA